MGGTSKCPRRGWHPPEGWITDRNGGPTVTRKILPSVRAGDPFTAAAKERPCACWDGFHYLGYLIFDPDAGIEVERFEAIPCKRCEAKPGERA
jgi:hypothetical protein